MLDCLVEARRLVPESNDGRRLSHRHFYVGRIMAERKGRLLEKSYVLIPFVLICAGVLAAALAPLLRIAVYAIRGKDVAMHRVVYRAAEIFALLLFIAFRKYLKSQVKASINPKQNPPGRPFIGGFLLGLVGLLVIAGAMRILGGAHFTNPHFGTSVFWEAFGMALGIGVAVAVFEEIFFRGIVFQGLRADLGTGLATIIAGAFFSLVHFMYPRKLPTVSGSDPLGGFKVLWHAFDRFGNFHEILPFAIGLLLIAILLTVAYLRTSALFLPIGIHASMVFFTQLNGSKEGGLFLAQGGRQSDLLFGSPDAYPSFLKGVDALPTWIIVFVLTIVVAVAGQRFKSRGGAKADSPRSG